MLLWYFLEDGFMLVFKLGETGGGPLNEQYNPGVEVHSLLVFQNVGLSQPLQLEYSIKLAAFLGVKPLL